MGMAVELSVESIIAVTGSYSSSGLAVYNDLRMVLTL